MVKRIGGLSFVGGSKFMEEKSLHGQQRHG
jgi:hypothetical protein